MIFEYAIDPKLAVHWGKDRGEFRLYKKLIGLGNPRIMSEFPKLKNWRRQFRRAAAGSDDNELLRITEIFTIMTERMVRRSTDGYDGKMSWLENAIQADRNEPFKAILSLDNPGNHAKVLGFDVIDDHPLWNVDSQAICARLATDMSCAISAMLSNCREIYFIDPHFGPENARHRRPLAAFLSAIKKRTNKLLPEIIEIHTSGKSDTTFFKDTCVEMLPEIIPKGMKIKLKRWNQKIGGEKLHERYILTDIGGIKVGPGLDDGNVGETFEATLLDRSLYSQRWTDYISKPAFDLSEKPLLIIGCG
jgi:hypothetical protein